ncbi:MAG: Gfo/Idh/MocA family oxidoreductase [Candidatus Korobacteraceae bacterium]
MKVGVVGCGYWGPNLVRNLIETNRCESIYCYDSNSRSTQKVQGRYPSLLIADSLEQLVSDCDAVMVATPVSSHYPVAMYALQRGKGVFVEKPLAASSQECEELIDLAEQKNATLMVGHTFVYSPPVRKIREYCDRGQLGHVYFLSSYRVNLGIHRRDVDVMWDLAPHDLSMFLYWMQETPVRVSAAGRACVGRMLDIASLRMEFASGAIAHLEVSWLAPSKLRRTVLVGSKSMVLYDDMDVDKVKLYDRGVMQDAPNSFGEYQLTYRSGDIVSPNLDATEPLLTQTHHFLDCVESGSRPATDGRLGLEIVRVLEAASQSVKGDGSLVDVEGHVPLPRTEYWQAAV